MIAVFFCYCLEAVTRTFVGEVDKEVWKMQQDLVQEGES